jgi:hypothetical protein
MVHRPQIQDDLRDELKLVTSSHFAVPAERVTHSDRVEALLSERRERKKRIEKLEEELREYQKEETIYSNRNQADLGN